MSLPQISFITINIELFAVFVRALLIHFIIFPYHASLVEFYLNFSFYDFLMMTIGKCSTPSSSLQVTWEGGTPNLSLMSQTVLPAPYPLILCAASARCRARSGFNDSPDMARGVALAFES
jgi:hypothetical protein